MSEIEEWKDVEGFEGHYQVSNIGRIKTLRREVSAGWGRRFVKERIMPTRLDSKGRYEMVELCKDCKTYLKILHRLVAFAFVENAYNKPEVNHKDGVRTNNNYKNLEWCTNKENIAHSIETGLANGRGQHNTMAKLSNIDILEIRASNKKRLELSQQYKISMNHISQIKNKRVWKHLT